MSTDETRRRTVDDEKLMEEIQVLATKRRGILAERDELWKSCFEGARLLNEWEGWKPSSPNQAISADFYAAKFQEAREASTKLKQLSEIDKRLAEIRRTLLGARPHGDARGFRSTALHPHESASFRPEG